MTTPLSTILAAELDSPVEHGALWATHGTTWTDGYSAVLAQAQALNFQGLTADATHARVLADESRVALDLAPTALAAQATASSTASTLASMQTGIRAYVETLEQPAQQYAAADDGTVTDAWAGPLTPQMRQARQAIAEGYTTELQDLMRQFSQADQQGAAALREHASTLAGQRFADGQPIGRIQAVDNQTLGKDPTDGQPIPPPPGGPVPPGKQWWYHYGTGWKLDDPLHPCDGYRIAGDGLGVLGGLLPPTSLPGVLADLNAIRSIIDIDQCEGP